MNKRKTGMRGVILLAVVVLILGLSLLLGTGCLIRKHTGIPCPGCGLTRAWFSVLCLDFAAAFRHHPMFWSVPVFGLFILFDGRLLKNQKVNNWLLYSLVAAYIGCYVVRLIGFLGGF